MAAIREDRVNAAVAAETALALAMADDPTLMLTDTVRLRDDADRALRGLIPSELDAVQNQIADVCGDYYPDREN